MLHDLDLSRLYARILSRPVFTALAQGQEPQSVFSFLRGTGALVSGMTVGSVFQCAYDNLSLKYQNEYFYKSTIANKIVFGRHSPKTSSFHVELPVGRSIVDVAIFNGTSTAYEIKTEMDTPRRLSTQTLDYLRAFDRVYVVTHHSLANKYHEVCDERVGILALNQRGALKSIRPAASNIDNVDQGVIFRMLRRNEYVPTLEEILGGEVDLPNGLIASHCEKLFRALPRGMAHDAFLGNMRKRTTDAETAEFVSCLPSYLRVLGYAAPLSRVQRRTLVSSLELAV